MYLLRIIECKQDATAYCLLGSPDWQCYGLTALVRFCKTSCQKVLTNIEMSFLISNAHLCPWVDVVTRCSHHMRSAGGIGAHFVTSAPPRRCGRVLVPHGAVLSMAAVLQVRPRFMPTE